MGGWIWKTKNGIKWISVPDWEKYGVIIGFSSRIGGVSQGPYASLNLGLHVNDREDAVLENRLRFWQALEGDPERAVCCQQVHGDRVVVVDERQVGSGVFELGSTIAGTDALVTSIPELYLTTFYADCIPVFFFDPVHRAVAMVHSGWKGTMSRISIKALNTMTRTFNTQPQDVWVFIGPGIDHCCFEIQPDLAGKVYSGFPDINGIIIPDGVRMTWDLKKTICASLQTAGVSADNISMCELCTSCDQEHFYSYRRDNGVTGRMGAVISMAY
ncbi:peptidoglycan editing factor PgeF [Syntrophomonas erecta subsp. sporosyntropha]